MYSVCSAVLSAVLLVIRRVLPCSCEFCRVPACSAVNSAAHLCALPCSCVFCRAPVCSAALL
eukprot:3001370-Pyramimonas_sp.AAC.1